MTAFEIPIFGVTQRERIVFEFLYLGVTAFEIPIIRRGGGGVTAFEILIFRVSAFLNTCIDRLNIRMYKSVIHS